MRTWFKHLDELLRGRKTAMLEAAQVDMRLRHFVPMAAALGAIYGFFMGWYSIVNRDPALYIQTVASMIKVPLLFLATLIVTFPSLYVFNALLGSRLGFHATLRLLVGAIVVNLAVAASFGPVLGFFTLSTQSYHFMVLLNVLLLTISGLVGLAFLMQCLRRLASQPLTIPIESPGPPATESGAPIQSEPPSARLLTQADGMSRARAIFRVWLVIYGLVGAQMGWLLRPFICKPDLEFTWFRARSGNFFEAIVQHIQALLAGR